MREIKIAIIFTALVIKSAADPLDEGNVAELGTLYQRVLIFHLWIIIWNSSYAIASIIEISCSLKTTILIKINLY